MSPTLMISRPHRPPATARSRPSRSVRSLSPAVLFAFALQGNAVAGEDPVSYTHLTLPTTPYV